MQSNQLIGPLEEPLGRRWLPSASDAPPLSLAQLLRRCALGDEMAFAEVYDATSSRVFGLVLRIVRNVAIAEEVSQEAYLQVWQTAARYDPAQGTVLKWLITLAHRRAVDRIRSTEAAGRRDTVYHREIPSVEHHVTAEAAVASIEAKRLHVALETLSPVQRRVLDLAYFEALTHTEIAQIIGVPLGTAKTRIRDGLVRLRKFVDNPA